MQKEEHIFFIENKRFIQPLGKKVIMLFYITAVIVLLIDQITKVLVRLNVEMYERLTWMGIELTYIENSGMAGGFFPGYARVFGVISILFVMFVFYLRRNEAWRGPIINISMGFLVGGAIGNGMDRLIFGQVTDFIVRGSGILNIADHALEIGIVLLIVHELVQWLRRRRNQESKEEYEGDEYVQ